MSEELHSAENDAPVGVEYADAAALWREVKDAVRSAVDSAYGTDPRHDLLARAVAFRVAFGRPLPWGLAGHFGRDTPPGEQGPA